MKKLFLSLFVSTTLVSVISCSNEDDSETTTNVLVEGTWKLTSLLTETALDINNNGTVSNDLLVESDCYLNETIVFNADGSGVINANSFLEVDFNSQTNTYISNCYIENDIFNTTYVVSGTTVTFNNQVVTVVATISESTMTFVVTNFFEIYDETDTLVVDEDLTFIYTKQ